MELLQFQFWRNLHTYTWSNGTNASTTSNLSPGQYDVVVTDVLNNKVTANFIITEPT
jgi:hypothetical protein